MMPLRRDYVADVDRAMRACPRCRNLEADAREQHRLRVYAEILRTQARTLSPLPRTAWPNGRPPKPFAEPSPGGTE